MTDDDKALMGDALRDALKRLDGWTAATRTADGAEQTGLTRTFRFASFEDAMRFMAAAVPRIGEMDHHPEWTNVYDRVDVWLSTHSAGHRPTEKDVALAAHLDTLFANHAG